MELFRQATTIMVLGMGLVFLFLALVILSIHGTAWLIRRYEARSGAGRPRGSEGDAGDAVAAAIAVALHERD
jgi:oxaloacetate decarboxylase gamma subunit